MYNIAKAPQQDREILFLNTAAKIGVNAAIIEKDFWVCLSLHYLFHESKWKNSFAFKGGTSLSKGYGLIERFSEDVDLILDWRVLGYSVLEPWKDRSATKQQKYTEEMNHRLQDFLEFEFIPDFQKHFSILIDEPVSVYLSKDDPGTVKLKYPRSYNEESILQEIRLEIGALTAWTPTKMKDIQSYAAECYPDIFVQKTAMILTTTSTRTFWEKATILHQEAMRPGTSMIPSRYSRHYYDLYCMTKKGELIKALENLDLLNQVVDFKMKFYPRGWARYELARAGSLKLVPPQHCLASLRVDYEKMRAMIYGVYPDFEEIMDELNALERIINTVIMEKENVQDLDSKYILGW